MRSQSPKAKTKRFEVNNFVTLSNLQTHNILSNPNPPQNEPIENIVFNDTLSSNQDEEVNVESERKEINDNDNKENLDFKITPKKKEYKKGVNIFCTIFWKKFEILTMFFFTNYFDSLSLSITTFLFAFSLNLFFTSFLYTNEVISQRYHDKGNFNLLSTIILSLLSQLLSYVFLILFRKIIIYSQVLNLLLSTKFSLKIKYDVKCCKCLSIIKKKILLYYVINYIFIIWIWYYLSLFCSIFKASQLNWIISCLFGYILHFCIMLCVVCFTTLFRYVANKYHSKRLNYNSLYYP